MNPFVTALNDLKGEPLFQHTIDELWEALTLEFEGYVVSFGSYNHKSIVVTECGLSTPPMSLHAFTRKWTVKHDLKALRIAVNKHYRKHFAVA